MSLDLRPDANQSGEVPRKDTFPPSGGADDEIGRHPVARREALAASELPPVSDPDLGRPSAGAETASAAPSPTTTPEGPKPEGSDPWKLKEAEKSTAEQPAAPVMPTPPAPRPPLAQPRQYPTIPRPEPSPLPPARNPKPVSSPAAVEAPQSDEPTSVVEAPVTPKAETASETPVAIPTTPEPTEAPVPAEKASILPPPLVPERPKSRFAGTLEAARAVRQQGPSAVAPKPVETPSSAPEKPLSEPAPLPAAAPQMPPVEPASAPEPAQPAPPTEPMPAPGPAESPVAPAPATLSPVERVRQLRSEREASYVAYQARQAEAKQSYPPEVANAVARVTEHLPAGIEAGAIRVAADGKTAELPFYYVDPAGQRAEIDSREHLVGLVEKLIPDRYPGAAERRAAALAEYDKLVSVLQTEPVKATLRQAGNELSPAAQAAGPEALGQEAAPQPQAAVEAGPKSSETLRADVERTIAQLKAANVPGLAIGELTDTPTGASLSIQYNGKEISSADLVATLNQLPEDPANPELKAQLVAAYNQLEPQVTAYVKQRQAEGKLGGQQPSQGGGLWGRIKGLFGRK